MKPVAKIDEYGILRNLRPDALRGPFPPNTDFYTKDQLKAAQVAVLREAGRLVRHVEDKRTINSMADELESSFNAGETT